MTTAPSEELLYVAGLMREALATCILPWFGKLADDQIGEKGPQDFVTIADTSAEIFLGERLTQYRPGSRIIGEEGVSANPALLSTLATGECWIIDPVDGTLLFKNTKPHFGTLISHSLDGKTQAGWLLETYLDDAGTLQNRIIMGDAASGVWISPTQNSPFTPLPLLKDRADTRVADLGLKCFKPGFLRDDLAARLADGSTAIAWNDTLYSSTSVYSAILRGEYIASFAAYTAPWDHSAGAFLVQLSGGVARHLTQDRDYQPDTYSKGLGVARDMATYRLGLEDALKPANEWPSDDPDNRKKLPSDEEWRPRQVSNLQPRA